jgi:putative SOS response-associated peptidase YedK
MCGRFASTLSAELLRRLFETAEEPPNLPPSWNIAPSQDALVVRRHPASGARRLDALRWGLVPHFTKSVKDAPKPINARAETVATSGLFRGAFAARRCLVPADCFFEWRKPDKQPFAIARQDGAPLALGGLWEGWRSAEGEVVRSFAIITTAANTEMRALHERMPLVLEPADWPRWLGETDAGADAAGLLRPAAAGRLRFWPVSSRVNSPRNNDADLLAPLAGGGAGMPTGQG